MRICHFTSAHPCMDTRILIKECRSLKEAGHEVFLVGKGVSQELSGIHFIGCGNPKGRLDRMLFFAKKVYKKALELDCEIYHFHDPELLRYGLKLKKKGKKVIFDSHEDVPVQIMSKGWIPGCFRSMIAGMYKFHESRIVKRLDAVIAATPYIAEQFQSRAKKTETIQNYPKLDEIKFQEAPFEKRGSTVCYVGTIAEIRGDRVMREAMKKADGTLLIAGKHEKETIEDSGVVEYVGLADRDMVNEIYGKAVAGLVVLQPCENYITSKPVKMYEYMAAGLPVICSDFPEWKGLMEETGAGIYVNPEDPDAVAEAINYMLQHRKEAQEMGRRGRKAVERRFSWAVEEKKLLALYQEL